MLRHGLLALATGLLLAGCATRAPAPVASVAPPPPPIPARPTPPGLASAALVLPERRADGGFVTINQGIEPAEAVWHVRSALNVAALGCRGVGEAALIAQYNVLLKSQKAGLAAAARAEGKRFGTEQDAHVTRVYNFFAQPPAHDAFCAAAAAVAAEAQTVAPADFTAFALAALPRLEAPFTDFYRAYDSYRTDLAAWDARYGPGGSGAPLLAYGSFDLLGWQPQPAAYRYAGR